MNKIVNDEKKIYNEIFSCYFGLSLLGYYYFCVIIFAKRLIY